MAKNILLRAALSLCLLLASVRQATAIEDSLDELRLRLVLEKYSSPLVGLENVLIETAVEYNLDWTLLAAISGTESSFAKRMPYTSDGKSCNNPFGWGIYGNNKLCFGSLEDAIRAVGKGIGTKYNTTSLETIGRTYNTVSTDGWIRHTRFFMNKIKNQEIPVRHLPVTL